MSKKACRVNGNPATGEQLHGMVVAADNREEDNRQRNKKQRDPGAFCKFCHQHDDGSNAGDESADSIDECALQPMGTTISPPVHDHARLGKGKGQEGADSIERYKPVGDTPKKGENAATEYRQDDDSVGVDQPPPAVPEDVREVVVLRDGAAETRKIGESSVG